MNRLEVTIGVRRAREALAAADARVSWWCWCWDVESIEVESRVILKTHLVEIVLDGTHRLHEWDQRRLVEVILGWRSRLDDWERLHQLCRHSQIPSSGREGSIIGR